jgi:hypothetical protein
MSMTPMVNIPFRAVASLFPQHRQMLDQIDAAVNGSQGQGQKWYNELLPTAVKKFTDALNSDDRDSMMADAVRSSILNLTASGQVPPPTATASERAAFLANVQTQAKNMLIARAVFGLFSPTPPSAPAIETDASQADYFYGVQGIHGLDSEFKKLVDDAGGDYGRATQIWAGLHPDKLAYEVPSSESTTKSALMRATADSHQWINSNLDFFTKYSSVAAYFIPPADQLGEFDMGAYHAELELGLRQHKSTAEFFDQVSGANAAAEYFAALKSRNAQMDAHPEIASDLAQSFDQWKQTFMALNPIFGQTQTDFSQANSTAFSQLAELRQMASEGDAPGSVPIKAVSNMVNAYDQYHTIMQGFSSGTIQDQSARADITNQYAAYMLRQVSLYPMLTGLYQGVFHTLDSSVLDPIRSNQS